MRRLIILLAVVGVTVTVAGTALAYTIYDPNLGHWRQVPIRSYDGIDTPRHGQFGDIEMSGCQLVLDEPSLGTDTVTPYRHPVSVRMFLQCDTEDLLFTGYEWRFEASRLVNNTPVEFDQYSGETTFDSGPRVPGHWGVKVFENHWSCKDVNPARRGELGNLVLMRGTITLFDTEGRDYPAKVSSRTNIVCPAL